MHSDNCSNCMVMSRTRVFKWHKRFKEGREDVEDHSRSGRSSMSRNGANVGCMRQVVRSDRRLTVQLIAGKLGMNRDNVWEIITEDSGVRKICAKIILKLSNNILAHTGMSRHARAS